MSVKECEINGVASADQYTSTSLKDLLASSTNYNEIDLQANSGYYVNSRKTNQKITCIEFSTPNINGTIGEIELNLYVSSENDQYDYPHIPAEGSDEEYFEEVLSSGYWDVICQLHYIDDSENIYPDYDNWKFYTPCNEYGNSDGSDCTTEEIIDPSYLTRKQCLFGSEKTYNIKFQHAKLKPNSKYAIILIPTWAHDDFMVSIQGTVANINMYYTLNGLVYIDLGSEFVPFQCYIDNGSSWDQYIPYVDNGSSWDLCS